MLYLGNASSDLVRNAMRDGLLGQMCTPAERRAPIGGTWWAADNGVYGKGWPGADRWWTWLQSLTTHADRCLFAVAPDVVGDHAATLERSARWLPKIQQLGYPAAFALQNGATISTVPWSTFDVAFIGGDDEFKLGVTAGALAREAQRRGLWVHCGRVNSGKRWRLMAGLDCGSVDGTFLRWPDKNLPRMLKWTGSDVQGVLT